MKNTIKAHKYQEADGPDVLRFKLTYKELERATEDGVAIVVRPQDNGGYGVFAVDVNDPEKLRSVGVNWYTVDDKSDLPEATQLLNRDLDKFHGRGGSMSHTGRTRDKGPRTEAVTKPEDTAPEGPLDDKAAAELYTQMVTASPARRENTPEADLERLRQLSGMPKETKESVNEDDSIGRTIADQMGGAGKMRAMLGATVTAIPNGLAIKWPNKQKTKGDLVEITLEPSDTYTMRFYNSSRGGKKLVKEYDDVYFDQLVSTFEDWSGWRLSL